MKCFKLAAVLFLILLQFVLFRHFWLVQMGSFLIYQDRIEPADAIIVLGGGPKERVTQGIELAKNKYGDWMMFTGEDIDPLFGAHSHWALEAQKLAVFNGIPKDKTIPITNSTSTRDDATLSKAICLEKHFRSLIVVSEPYHTRRAHYVFNKVYKETGIKIMVYPVQHSRYKRDGWWKYKQGYWDTNTEYQKMLYYLLKGYLI
jgi:uncharacterized SAM-binding protein YcdF (DUF218 family)